MPSRNLRAVIMAGGRGTRLAPYTSVLPKPLLPVDGKPILEVVLHQLRQHGCSRVTICAGHLAELIRTYFGDGERVGLPIDYVVEAEPLGTIAPLRLIDDFHEPILVMNGDILTTLDYSDLYSKHLRHQPLLTIATCVKQCDIPLGVVEFNGSREITGFREKPSLDVWVSMGTYVASPAVLEHIPSKGPFGADQLVTALIAADEMPIAYPFEGVWQDLAEADDCTRATEYLQTHRDALLP